MNFDELWAKAVEAKKEGDHAAYYRTGRFALETQLEGFRTAAEVRLDLMLPRLIEFLGGTGVIGTANDQSVQGIITRVEVLKTLAGVLGNASERVPPDVLTRVRRRTSETLFKFARVMRQASDPASLRPIQDELISALEVLDRTAALDFPSSDDWVEQNRRPLKDFKNPIVRSNVARVRAARGQVARSAAVHKEAVKLWPELSLAIGKCFSQLYAAPPADDTELRQLLKEHGFTLSATDGRIIPVQEN